MIYADRARKIPIEPLALLISGEILCTLTEDRAQRCVRMFWSLVADGGYPEVIEEICHRYEAGLFFIQKESREPLPAACTGENVSGGTLRTRDSAPPGM